jgi:methionine sulfoxide reductase heme-binding subunit
VDDPADLCRAGGDGVAAFAYAFSHFCLYIVDENFDLAVVASEIVQRIYLTIGFVALLGLAALAATSTDGMVRRMGGKAWQRLHRFVYVIGVLAVVHYCFQSKLEQWEPTIMAGLLAWLLGYRVLLHFFGVRGRLPAGWVVALGAVVPLLTGFGEAVYFHLAFHVAIMRVLQANLSLVTGIRPAPVVLGFTAAAALAALIRAPAAKARQRGGAAAKAPAKAGIAGE